MLVSTTSEVIKKLQKYETKYGVGAIVSIETICSNDRKDNYSITIVNDSLWNGEDEHYHSENIIISAIDDDEVFPRKRRGK